MKGLVSKILLIGLLTGCNESKQYFYDNYTIDNCIGGSKTFRLPAGWSEISSYDTTHGNIESLIYPDSSVVTILCATSSELNLGDIFDKNKNQEKKKYLDVPLYMKMYPRSGKKNLMLLLTRC